MGWNSSRDSVCYVFSGFASITQVLLTQGWDWQSSPMKIAQFLWRNLLLLLFTMLLTNWSMDRQSFSAEIGLILIILCFLLLLVKAGWQFKQTLSQSIPVCIYAIQTDLYDTSLGLLASLARPNLVIGTPHCGNYNNIIQISHYAKCWAYIWFLTGSPSSM